MTRPFDLGGWRVDPARGALIGADGAETRLEPRLMDLLLLFAASPGRVIAKDEIVASVWSGRAIGDDTLAAAISRLRTALGETKDKRFIETLPKRGYRLLIVPDDAPSPPPPREDGVAELLRKGHAALGVPLPQSLAQARVYFEAAIRVDPKSARAHAALASALLSQALAGLGPGNAALAKVSAHAATALDPDLALGWAILGCATLIADRDFAAADAALQNALIREPGLAMTHRFRALALATIGRFVDAEREARRAVEIEPLSFGLQRDVLQILLAARRFVPAIAEAKKVLSLSAQSADAWSAKGWAHAFLGQYDEGVDALLESIRLMGTDVATIAQLQRAYLAGFEAFCTAGADLLSRQHVMFVPKAMDLAMLNAMAGRSDAAFSALNEAVRVDDPTLLLLPYLPHLDRLRNDPRFAALLERVRLVR